MGSKADQTFGREELSRQFPILKHGLYVNHAAVGPWPQCAADAVARFAQENAQTGAANYREWIKRENELRRALAELVGAPSLQDIALLKNTTEGISVVAEGVGWRQGDNVVIPAGEFSSNRLPWQALARKGVELREVDIRAAEDPESALIGAMDRRTRMLSVSAVQWSDGFRLDLARLGEACGSGDMLFLVDAIQQLGALPLDVQACRIDMLAADAHKWLLGPEGIAVFYCRGEVRPQLQLRQHGWHMLENPWAYGVSDSEPSATARRFEAGSPNSLGQAALHASLGLLLETGMEFISQRVLRNTNELIDQLPRIPGVAVSSRTEPERRSGIVSFLPGDIPAGAAAGQLATMGVICAARGDSIRLSPHFYQGKREMAGLLECIERLVSG